jgi:hypothetical protein
MNSFNRQVRWIVCGLLISLLFALGHPLRGYAQSIVAQRSIPAIASELINLPQVPFNQFPAIPCTAKLKYQYNQQAKVPLNCQIGTMVSADKLIVVGNLANFGLTEASLESIARVNNININAVSADQLRKVYDLVTPNKLLSDRFSDLYQNANLDKIPLVRDALVEQIITQYNLGNMQPLQQLNTLLSRSQLGLSVDIESLTSPEILKQISNLKLNQVVLAIPDFGDFSFSNLSDRILKSYSIVDAIPGLTQTPIGSLVNIESLTLYDLRAIGAPNISMSQLSRPPRLSSNVSFGRFDLPLSNDEKDLGRQISGGIVSADGSLQKQNCRETCKYVEINSALDPSYNGSTWLDAENYVPDGFGAVCWTWLGGCYGPAGNNPLGSNLRILFTNIDAARGTAQVSFTYPICYDVAFLGRTCTPSIFPIPSGLPLYTIREGDWMPFVAPRNYGS